MSKQTPFHREHKKLGAKIIDFGGFDMPVQYQGIKQEHLAVRERAGLFDVSHMGEFFVRGPKALDLIQKVTINEASKLVPGKAQYTAMCYENGGIVDDLLVYMLSDEEYMLVVNASNIEKDWDWIEKHNTAGAEIENCSDEYALIALQGPKSIEILQKLTETDVSGIKFYTFEQGAVAGEDDVIISATGYTGEKGFELYIDTKKADAVKIWNDLLNTGKEFGLEPAGLGARDTLRLEMGFALYGNDITKETNPIEANLGWLTKLDKEDFVGKEAIAEVKEKGRSRKLTGFVIDEGRNVPRSGYKILDSDGNEIGFVTSGTQSISLNKGIGMGYIQVDHANEGEAIQIQIRKKEVSATVTKPPFYKK